MNAVKNCLVVLAAAVALASCSADPTKDQAGKSLTLTVTPGSVNARAGDTVEVFASALDPLGGAANGSFTITGGTGTDFTAKIDTSYNPVYAGDRPQARTRIVVAALHASNGSFTVSGTGGSFTIPVRIAPDSTNGEAALSKSTLAEIDTFTVTLPSGIRVTSGFTVGIYHNALGGDSALFSPTVTAVSADSSVITIATGPNSGGKVRLGGVANTVTPTLTYAMRTASEVTSPTLDTTGVDSTTAQVAWVSLTSVQAPVLDTISAAIGDTFKAHAPAGWRFTPASKVHIYKGPAAADSNDGVAQPVVVSVSADSATLTFIPAPGAVGQARVEGMVLQSHPTLYAYSAVRSRQIVKEPGLSFNPTYARANNLPNTPVTVTMPAGVKLTPTSVLSIANQALPPIQLSIAADSNSMVVLLPPVSNGLATISHLRTPAASYFDLTLTSTSKSPAVAAITDQGGDDPAGSIPTINLPATGTYGFWDLGTFEVEDQSADAGGPGINSQVYKYVLGVNATIVTDVQWSIGRDIDAMLLDYGATTNQATYGGFSGATGTAFHEVQNSGALTAGNYMLDLIDWSPAYPDTPAVGAAIRLSIKVQ
jgi:hypothetical protein